MSDGRFIVTTTLEGYINALQPGGKFNNCTISFSLPADVISDFDAAYEKAIEWGKNKMDGKRFTTELPKWDENGLIKVSYGGDSTTPMFPWIDTDGEPISLDTPVWKGTVVKLIIDLKPYTYGNKVGCSLKVKGAQVIKLVGSGGSDGGTLDDSDVASIFGKTNGFKSNSPNFEPSKEVEDQVADYEVDEIPF